MRIFLILLLVTLVPAAHAQCGLAGTISDRLRDCSQKSATLPGQRFDAPTKQRLFARPVFNYYLTPFVLDATGRERNPVSSEWIPRFSLEADE